MVCTTDPLGGSTHNLPLGVLKESRVSSMDVLSDTGPGSKISILAVFVDLTCYELFQYPGLLTATAN